MAVIGFTGTRSGMTEQQWCSVTGIVSALAVTAPEPLNAVHGDCIGADADFDAICASILGAVNIGCRPCTFANMRANTGAKELSEPKPPMQRNRDIVADADVMIACPPNDTPIKSGSGTWATIGFARKAKKPLAIVYPDGRVAKENWQP